MLMADRFRIPALADFTLHPAAGIFAWRFPGKSQSPFPDTTLEIRLFHGRQIANPANSDGMQIFFHHFADPWNLPHRERREKSGLCARQNAKDTVGLRLIRSDLRHEAGTCDADRAIQI